MGGTRTIVKSGLPTATLAFHTTCCRAGSGRRQTKEKERGRKVTEGGQKGPNFETPRHVVLLSGMGGRNPHGIRESAGRGWQPFFSKGVARQKKGFGKAFKRTSGGVTTNALVAERATNSFQLRELKRD